MLRDRATGWRPNTVAAATTDHDTKLASPIFLAAYPLFAIVDGELVNVLGTTDIPGMSPAYWCSDSQGISAPVSFREARIFTTAQEALQVLGGNKTRL